VFVPPEKIVEWMEEAYRGTARLMESADLRVRPDFVKVK